MVHANYLLAIHVGSGAENTYMKNITNKRSFHAKINLSIDDFTA